MDLLRHRRTQTNEVGRCAILLPVLARLQGPLALVEVGASAGLCLLLDRYRYRYGDRSVGDASAPVLLDCEVSGPVPVPKRVPEVAWRRGIDVARIDVTDDDDVRWLEACVWPDQTERIARLLAAGHPLGHQPSTSRSRTVRAAADPLRPRAPSPVHHAARARRSASAMMASPHRIASVPQTEPSLLGYGKPLPWKLRNAIDDAP